MDSSAIDVLLTLFFTSFYLLKQFFPRIKSINSKLQESMKMVVVCSICNNVYISFPLMFSFVKDSNFLSLFKTGRWGFVQKEYIPSSQQDFMNYAPAVKYSNLFFVPIYSILHYMCQTIHIQRYQNINIIYVFVLKHDCTISRQ